MIAHPMHSPTSVRGILLPAALLTTLATAICVGCSAPATPVTPANPATPDAPSPNGSTEATAFDTSAPTGLEAVQFMAGDWRSPDGALEEHWTSAAAGSMLGVGRTIRGGATVFYEYLRIAREGDTITLYASPAGRGVTPFTLARATEDVAVFENPEHDFPQRIVYRRDGPDRLRARTETLDGARGMDFVYERVPSTR